MHSIIKIILWIPVVINDFGEMEILLRHLIVESKYITWCMLPSRVRLLGTISLKLYYCHRLPLSFLKRAN